MPVLHGTNWKFAVIALSLALAACGSERDRDANETAFALAKIEKVSLGDRAFTIYDRDDLGRLLVEPDLKTAALGAAFEILPHGLTIASRIEQPGPHFAEAVRMHFLNSRRQCTIDSAYKVVNGRWGFSYRCLGSIARPNSNKGW